MFEGNNFQNWKRTCVLSLKGHTGLPGRCEKKDHIYSQCEKPQNTRLTGEILKDGRDILPTKKQNQTD